MPSNDIKLHCREATPIIPIVFIHGNGESSEYFSGQIEYFSSRRTVLAPDMRGHGDTPRGDAPFTLFQFAEDLKCFLDSKRIEKADIVGFSDGANVALIFTLKYPERVNKLILNSGNLSPDGLKSGTLMSIKFKNFLAKMQGEKGKKKRELFSLMLNGPDIDPDELFAIDLPVMVIAGTKDVIKKKHTKLISDSIWGSKLVFLKGDHYIASKNCAKFNRTIEKFLNS